jgi:hypothetical protein
MTPNAISDQAIIRLSALWAIVEITLGGVLHAMRIPLTGLFVGSIALACIFLIARSANSYKTVLQALGTVMAIKMMATPHASPFAYIAMAAQTLCCLPLIGQRGLSRRWVTSMFLVASIYSPLQKLVILYVTFGQQGLMTVLNEFRNWFAPQLSSTEFILIPLTIWLGVHMLVGFFLAKWLIAWSTTINEKKELHNEWILTRTADVTSIASSPRSQQPYWLMPMVVILGLFLLYFFEQQLPDWMHVLWRPLLIILFWQLIVRPIAMFIVQKRATTRLNDGHIRAVMDEFPNMWSIIAFARKKSSSVTGSIHRFHVFLKITIMLSVMNHSECTND